MFYLKFKVVMIKLEFIPSESEPCLFSKKANGSMIFIVVYVDDCYVIGSDMNLKAFISDIQMEFQIKIQENPTDYLSCDIHLNTEKGFGWIGQPHLIKRLEKSFGSLVNQSNIRYAAPGTPNQTIVCPQTEEDQPDAERQMKYRLAVGTLLQFVKHILWILCVNS
jgi:hypothetical protein